ncbi:peptidoglycan/LPS O-acetylase OafA/YrhL [Arthrobacter pascens]|uniref:acyltransferase family protein n=1 Tax=Arthrobacter pascens TaxID=1677 RepID=UPI00278AC91D|nr:acyltransferase [Arthrobacter pascens]MDQ0636122.1 peptidoglycan/LPS O-acetylase OafA/YrhL [Arthrobacter pascens]
MQDLTVPGGVTKSRPDVRRLNWLDGVRALAATFVVLHHVWLMSYGGYPGNNGPWWTDWLVYGHLAVSVFIVVSGYSLALAPADQGMRLRHGGLTFMRRRFWRIVPPYWAALGFSALLIATGLIASPSGSEVTVQDIAIHGLLIQDAISTTPPNGVFWSIAVEWHIYFLFPLLVFCLRRYRIMRVIPAILLLVLVQHIGGQYFPFLAFFERFSTAYFALFAFGTAAVWLASKAIGARMAVCVAVTMVVGFIVVAAVAGPARIVATYFWVDLAVGGATAALLTALDQGKLRWLTSLLGTRFLVSLGRFAFSIYLIHAPVLELLRIHVVARAGLTGAAAFLTLALLGIPLAIGSAYLFFIACERPFLTIRGFRQLLAKVFPKRAQMRPLEPPTPSLAKTNPSDRGPLHRSEPLPSQSSHFDSAIGPFQPKPKTAGPERPS